MRRPISLSHVVRRFALQGGPASERADRPAQPLSLYLAASLILMSMLLSACSGLFGGSSAPTPTPSTRPLSRIGWCAKPLMVFRDEGAVTPVPSATATGTATPRERLRPPRPPRPRRLRSRPVARRRGRARQRRSPTGRWLRRILASRSIFLHPCPTVHAWSARKLPFTIPFSAAALPLDICSQITAR